MLLLLCYNVPRFSLDMFTIAVCKLISFTYDMATDGLTMVSQRNNRRVTL